MKRKEKKIEPKGDELPAKAEWIFSKNTASNDLLINQQKKRLLTDEHDYYYKSLYDKVEKQEELRIYRNNYDINKNDLQIIAEEIQTRIKITQLQIFKIGELLIEAKKVCSQSNKSFQEWITDNFDFSKETAQNFMKVYTNCMGYEQLALKLPPTILYQISAPSVSEELRNFLFLNTDLENTKNEELKQMIKKYKAEGIEAVQEDVKKFHDRGYIKRKIHFTFDNYEKAYLSLIPISEKFIRIVEEFEYNIKYKENTELNNMLHDLIATHVKALQSMEAGLKEARQRFDKITL